MQQLWSFENDGTSRGGIFSNIQPVGYHVWGNENIVVMFVLGSNETPATLQIGDLRTGEVKVLAENPGRSIQKVPGRHAVSFVRKTDQNNWWIDVYDIDTGEFTRLLSTLPTREDYAWMPNGSILMGDGSKLFQALSARSKLDQVSTGVDASLGPHLQWTEIADLSNAGVGDITRLAVNNAGTLLAIVSNRENN